jgi:methionyl aminopeptidase
MPIVLKSPAEIERMAAAGAIVASTHAALRGIVEPGITTRELDALAYRMVTEAGAYPSFLGYRGYPASICASVNEVVLHGIPNDRALQSGDIISIDIGVKLDGYHGDAAATYAVGVISDAAQDLIDVTERCFWAGFEALQEGGRLGDATSAIQQYAESRGYGVIREYTGHGIGRQMHEDPSIPNYGQAGKGTLLRRGMTFAMEPMLSIGSPETRVLEDGWTVITIDGSLAAHYEHTVAIAAEGPRILTGVADAVI